MQLKANFEIHGLSKVITGKRKAEGIAEAGDLYEVDDKTGKKHIAEGYASDPDAEAVVSERTHGAQVIEGEIVSDDESLSLGDIAPKGEAPASTAAPTIGASKKSGGKGKGKKAATPETPAAPEENTSGETTEDDDLGLGLDDDSDSVE